MTTTMIIICLGTLAQRSIYKNIKKKKMLEYGLLISYSGDGECPDLQGNREDFSNAFVFRTNISDN